MDWWFPYFGMIPFCAGMSRSKLSKYKNNIEFQNFFEIYFSMFQSLFKWDGLPDTCDERMIERCMLTRGQAMIAKVNGTFLSLAAAAGANINLYGYPINGWGYGMNGYNKEFVLYVPGADDSHALTEAASGLAIEYKPEAVVCYDNVDRYPMVGYIYSAAQRLSDLIRSCDVAVQNLKSPYIIQCDESEVKSVNAAFEKRNENNAAIIAAKGLSLENFKVWPSNLPPEVLTVFWEQFRNIEAQLLETFGVNSNDNTDKKAQLLTVEVNANNEAVSYNLHKRLEQRQLFCERVNNLWGLGISCHLNEEVIQYARPDDIDDYDPDGSDDGAMQGDGDRRGDAGGNI